MENTVDTIYKFISDSFILSGNAQVERGVTTYFILVTPIRQFVGKSHGVRIGNLIFDVDRTQIRVPVQGFSSALGDFSPALEDRSAYVLYFYYVNKYKTVNYIAKAEIAADYKRIIIKDRINYNGEYVYSIEMRNDKLKVTTYDNVITYTMPDGTKTTSKPDGTKHILKPSGLLTVITAEEVITVLSVTASIATIAQLILMIIDVRSKKRNENKINAANSEISEKLDEIKEIAVLMSDGTRPSFKSWQHDPDEVKKFVETFQSSPTVQKPLRVTFTLKNGSKIVIKVDENSAEQQKLLDEFIEHLKS